MIKCNSFRLSIGQARRKGLKTYQYRASNCVGVGIVVAVLAGCGEVKEGDRSVQSAQPSQKEARIDSVSLLTIGNDPDDPLYRVVGAVLTEDELVVAQASSMTLRFYDRRTGELERSVGGPGEGPGEYELLASLQLVGDRLYTFDRVAYRLTVYDLSGTLERTVQIPAWGEYDIPELVGVFPDGSLLVSAHSFDPENSAKSPVIRRYVMVLGRYDPNGVFLDSLGSYLGLEHYVTPFGNGGEAVGGVPFSRQVLPGVMGDEYYLLDSNEAVISVFNTAGDSIGELEPATAPEPVRIGRADRDLFADLDVDSDELPQFYPFYSHSKVQGGALWILRYVNPYQDHSGEWSVYSFDGDLVGRVTASERLVVLAVDGDTAAVLVRDELGVETVELRRLVGWS